MLPSGLHRLSRGTEMFVGTALPVRWAPVRKGPRITEASPSTWTQVSDFLVPEVVDGTGQVYIAGAGPVLTEAALAGGLSLTYLADVVRFEGVVLGGAIRDRAVVEAAEFPVVASNFVPTDTQGSYRVESVGDSCVIDNVLIRAGDWIFSDGNGTVIVPPSHLAEVMAAATAVELVEQRILERLRAGERLPKVVDEVGRI